MDNEVESYNGNPRFLMEPLEVMLRSYLDRSWFGKGEVSSGTIKGAVIELLV